MTFILRGAALGLGVLLLALTAGCGAGTVKVKGQVTFDGKPLEKGVIAFAPTQGTMGPGAGGEIVDGKYELKQAIAGGTYTVEINSWQKTGKKVKGQYGETEEQVNVIPEKYNKATILRFMPETNPNEANFVLDKSEKKS